MSSIVMFSFTITNKLKWIKHILMKNHKMYTPMHWLLWAILCSMVYLPCYHLLYIIILRLPMNVNNCIWTYMDIKIIWIHILGWEMFAFCLLCIMFHKHMACNDTSLLIKSQFQREKENIFCKFTTFQKVIQKQFGCVILVDIKVLSAFLWAK